MSIAFFFSVSRLLLCVCGGLSPNRNLLHKHISWDWKCLNAENLPMWFLCVVFCLLFCSFFLSTPHTTSLFDKTKCESIKVKASCWMKRFLCFHNEHNKNPKWYTIDEYHRTLPERSSVHNSLTIKITFYLIVLCCSFFSLFYLIVEFLLPFWREEHIV